MCRPMPPTILPTVILVWAPAELPSDNAITAARAAARRILMVRSSRPVCPGGYRAKAYTSAGRHVELGRDVLHFLQRRLEQRSRQELLDVGQGLVRRPLL